MSDISKLFVLVNFYEENNFCVLRLTDAIPQSNSELISESLTNLSCWDQKKTMDCRYGEKIYPARFLQFGSNKKNMELIVDKLINGSLCPEEVDTIQREEIPPKRKDKDPEINIDLKKKRKQTKAAIKMKETDLIDRVKEKDAEKHHKDSCIKCPVLESKQDILLKECMQKERENEDLKSALFALQEKYRNLKKKYKSLKKNNKSVAPSASVDNQEQQSKLTDLTVIGPSTTVDTYKLSSCRNADYSKFTGDVLDVIFGPEVLGTSVLKGIAGCQKVSILNPVTINDIQMYVSRKFNVTPNQVRCAIRQKLNVCHKAYKKAVSNSLYASNIMDINV